MSAIIYNNDNDKCQRGKNKGRRCRRKYASTQLLQ